jgi:hypothetical protein
MLARSSLLLARRGCYDLPGTGGGMQALDQHVGLALNFYAHALEQHFSSHVLAYSGPIYPLALTRYREAIEGLRNATNPPGIDPEKLVIVLTTPGGIVETVEKMVEITRHHYLDVSFVVPEMAMSAGTVWCMSGDRIWMDYASSLGPIDPQVQSQSANGGLVPALGYLDKVNEFIGKANANTLSAAEVIMLKSLDLAELRRFEQAKDLSISLLKQWLVSCKFKNWTHHRTTNPGAPVTPEERLVRAEQIAVELMNNSRWNSHGRMIGMKTLKDVLRLEIDDYSNVPTLRDNAKMYSSLLSEYLERQHLPMIIHTARS